VVHLERRWQQRRSCCSRGQRREQPAWHRMEPGSGHACGVRSSRPTCVTAEPSAAFHALPDLASVRAAQIHNSRSPGILRRSPSSMNFAFARASSAAIWAIALSMSSHSVSVAWLSVQLSGASHRALPATLSKRLAPALHEAAAPRANAVDPCGGSQHEPSAAIAWRRECQSIPIERQSIFDLPGAKLTVRATAGKWNPAGIGRALSYCLRSKFSRRLDSDQQQLRISVCAK
jgi:hypothetical protein